MKKIILREIKGEVKEQELRKGLLEGMCIAAEGRDILNIRLGKVIKNQFHPGVADKFLFNKIIDKHITYLMKEASFPFYESILIAGAHLFRDYYQYEYKYPNINSGAE